MKFWGREKAAVMRRKRRVVRRRQLCMLPLQMRLEQQKRRVEEFVRSAEFYEYLLKPRPAKAPGKAKNPTEARKVFAPLAVLGHECEDLLRAIGTKKRVLRLTDRGADKMWRKHGPGMRYRQVRDLRRRHVPREWYADIPRILREAKPFKNKSGHWQLNHAGLERVLVIDLDNGRNPVLISYHGKKSRK